MLTGNIPPPAGEVDVRFVGLRSARGVIHACLSRSERHFLHCERDPAARRASIAAGTDARLVFTGVAPGDYALSVLHDENHNDKIDTMLGIPREGVGFSGNPVLGFGPPRFAAVRFPVGIATVQQVVKMKYFL